MKAIELLKTYIKDRDVHDLVDLIWRYYGEKFEKAYAARFVHDARPGGLDNHTANVMRFVNLILDQYENISILDKDFVYFATLIHDIGKIKEYTEDGGRGTYHYATHLALGVEIITEFRIRITKVFGEDGYYRLMSVIHQHHGEFSEKCHTLESYVIHKADMIEAQMAKLNEDIVGQNFAHDGVQSIGLEFGKYKVF